MRAIACVEVSLTPLTVLAAPGHRFSKYGIAAMPVKFDAELLPIAEVAAIACFAAVK
jgi:hypothetical protein